VDQGASSLLGIRMMFSIIPASAAFLGAMAIFFYPITDSTMKGIEHDLAMRKSAGA
jgi:Na+/melibiose symporter-like transporter